MKFQGTKTMTTPFPGNPKLYLRIAVLSTIALVVWLYGGTVLIQYLWSGKTSLLGWKIMLAVAVFALWYGRFAYRWMMRLDGQYGSGSGWTFSEVMVKLPEMRVPGQSPESPQGSSDSK